MVIRLCGSDAAVAAGPGGQRRRHHAQARRRATGCRSSYLRPEFQIQALQALFPEDELHAAGLAPSRGRDRRGPGRSNLWSIAELFTGKGEDFRELREHQPARGRRARAGAGGPHPALAAAADAGQGAAGAARRLGAAHLPEGRGGRVRGLPPASAARRSTRASSCASPATSSPRTSTSSPKRSPSAAASPTSPTSRSATGAHPARASLARVPARRPSGTPGVRGELAESASYANLVRSANLEGVTVILDAGHGGRDSGAILDGVWESTYVYDIVMRVQPPAAGADRGAGGGDHPRRQGVDGGRSRRAGASRGHAVLTTPPYAIADARVGINLRWYLANSVYGKAVSSGKDPRTAWSSSRSTPTRSIPRCAAPWPTCPACSATRATTARPATVYSSRREVQEQPRVDFAYAERAQQRGPLARAGQAASLDAMRRRGIADPPVQAGARQDHPQQERLGAGGAALQRGAGEDAARGLQPRQRAPTGG